MKPMPWRFLVVTDLGSDAGPVPIALQDVDSWLAGLGLVVPLPAGDRTVPVPIPGVQAFAPAGLASALAQAAPGTVTAGADLDVALHCPALQRIESAWRGLRLLLGHAAGSVSVEVLSAPRARLAERLHAVFAQEMDRPDPVALVLLDFDFSHRPADLALLRELAGMAKVLQAPLVAGASAAFFELRYLVQAIALPDLQARLRTPAHLGWMEFQGSEPARWVALTLNRWLQRAPYTAEDGHAECVSEAEPDTYLWGRGTWLVGAAAARSVREHGQAVDLTGSRCARFDGQATRPWPAASNAAAALAAEVPLGERQVIELSRTAFTPLVAPLRGDAVILPATVTVYRPSPAQLTIEGTLGYQMLAARLARFCGLLLDGMPAGGREECAAWLRAELLGFLGPFAGAAPEEAVKVEVREPTAEDPTVALANVQVRPKITLEGRAPEFAFVLPLRI